MTAQSVTQNRRKAIIEACAGYAGFGALGILSRFVPAVFALFVIYGIAFPLVWAAFTHQWREMGFTKRNVGKAILWGTVVGLAWGAYTFFVFGTSESLPPLWGLQVAIAVPIWFLIMSPFQELFFRGWMQPRLQSALGQWVGLALTALAFTVWHFFPQFEGTSTSTLPVASPLGALSTFVAGLLVGYIQQRTRNIAAPWIAHAIAGIALVLIGKMTFISYT